MLQANTTYHIAIHQKSGTGSNAVLEAFIVDTTGGDTAFGAAFAQTSSGSSTTAVVSVQVGATNSTTLDARFDNIDIDTAALPGPTGSRPAPALAVAISGERLGIAATMPLQDGMVALDDRALALLPYDMAVLRNVAPAPLAQGGSQQRVIRYGYDGLNRLTGAQESGATTNQYTYSYDGAGNRTDGGRTYNAANQVVGWTYDNAGNLLSDGTTSYTYDALSRVASYTAGGGTRTDAYNGDGTLVAQTLGGTTTRYVQDLAAPLSQVLSSGGTDYVYGNERLYASTSGTKTWYGGDALGSVRQTLNNSGAVQSTINYDPWGVVQSGSVPTFGFTGEQQDGSLVNLRARWYNASRGSFTARDSFAGFPEQPYSLHPYQYGYSNPELYKDPTGRCVFVGIDTLICAGVVFTVFEAIALLAAAGTATYALYQSCIVQHGCDRVAIDLQRLLDSRNATFDTTPAPAFPRSSFPQGPPHEPLPPLVPRPFDRSSTSSGGFSFGHACDLPGGFDWLDPTDRAPVVTAPWDGGTVSGPVVLMANPNTLGNGQRDKYNRATSGSATLVKEFVGPELGKIPFDGFDGNVHDRSHLIAKRFGGTGSRSNVYYKRS